MDEEEEGKPLNNLGSSSSSSSATKSSKASCRTSNSRSSNWTKTTVFISFFVILIFSGVVFSGFDVVVFTGPLFTTTSASTPTVKNATTTPRATPARTNIQYQLNCSAFGPEQQKCPAGYPVLQEPDHEYTAVCPEYFRWIHEDLRPWKDSGITRQVLESNDMKWAHFRFIIYKGKPYLHTFHRAWQTRDVFTIWGLVQLLRLYPGRIPDLELIFCAEDIPVVKKENYTRPDDPKPPPLFRYCGADWSFDIPFPDWSFWGWAETNIKPWTETLKDIEDKAAEMEWKDREPYAYWKGNPYVSHKRGELMQCRPDKDHDWNARLDVINWGKERSDGFKGSRLEDQCKHRYKIYVEGGAWSVSEKYILACDAMTLLIMPEFYDFFVRGMQPMQHYWPIRPDNKCRDIKFAVDWGNTHPWEAKDIGEAGTKFATHDLSMQNVYDYMYHTLNEYAKLQRYEVTLPPEAVEICSESMACLEKGLVKKFMEDSLVKAPSNALPCSLPPPYEPHELKEFLDKKESISSQIGLWEAKAWENSNMKH